LLSSSRSSGKRAALLLAGAWAGACVFPEYDNDRSLPGGASGNGAVGSSAGQSGSATGGGGEAGLAGAPGTAGVGGSGSGGGGTATIGGAEDGGGGGSPSAGGEAGEGIAGAGGECTGLGCGTTTCTDGVKNGTEAFKDCGDSQGKCGDCSFHITKHVIGGGSFSGTAIVTWNATGLVFDFTVVDNTPRNDSPDPWNDDAVEVFLDLDNGKSTSYQGNDFQVIVPRDESATHSPQGSANTGAMLVERSSNAAGYTVELTIPWSTIGEAESPPLGQTIGFDLAVDDDSDGGDRNAQVVVFGTADNYLNTSPWGEITLN
jgi:hypothetical protein